MRHFLERHCFDCHSGDQRKGGIALDRAGEPSPVLADRKTWAKALAMPRAGKMPPKGRPAPPSGERIAAAEWIDEELRSLDCSGPIDPGRVTIRRLNSSEYNNTIRDLLAIEWKPADDFPSDDVG